MNAESILTSKREEFSQRYQSAMRSYLETDSGLGAARDLGALAARTGFTVLALAAMHEEALQLIMTTGCRFDDSQESVARAGIFFAEALEQVERSNPAAGDDGPHLNQIIKALGERAVKLADSVTGLKQEVFQCKATEKSLRTSQEISGDLLRNSREMQEELRHLSRELLSAQEEERRKLSKDLHDVVAQTLAGITVRLAALRGESNPGNKELLDKIAGTQRLVEKSVEMVHRFALELRPSLLDDLGLIPALQSFMRTFMEDTGVRVTLKAFAGIEQSDGAQRTALYRVAQEALNNVARHAHASLAEVSIREQNGSISMEIRDNGCGFELDRHAPSGMPHHPGLLGMRERIEMVGGTFSVESAPGEHTTVRVQIPGAKVPPKNGFTVATAKSKQFECP